MVSSAGTRVIALAGSRGRGSHRPGLREAIHEKACLFRSRRYLAGRPSGDPLHDLVAEWQEETLDELWWRRIKALLDEELALVDRRVAIEAELRLMPPNEQAARASGLRDEQRRIRERLTAIAADLSDQFGYEAGISPNVGNEEQLDRLRQARNADRYRAWQRAVLELVRSSAGRLPWE